MDMIFFSYRNLDWMAYYWWLVSMLILAMTFRSGHLGGVGSGGPAGQEKGGIPQSIFGYHGRHIMWRVGKNG
jgi:hypothetical protein